MAPRYYNFSKIYTAISEKFCRQKRKKEKRKKKYCNYYIEEMQQKAKK